MTGSYDTTAEDYAFDADVILDLLARLRELQARCTCSFRSDITQCPNYRPGDELNFNGSDMRIKRQNSEWGPDLGPGGGQPVVTDDPLGLLIEPSPDDPDEDDEDEEED